MTMTTTMTLATRDVTVEAVQITGQTVYDPDPKPPALAQIAEWCGASVTVGHDRAYEVAVPAGRHGVVYARPSDWIVKLPGGRVRLFSNDEVRAIFRLTPPRGGPGDENPGGGNGPG